MLIDAGLKHKNPREAADSGIILWRQNFSLFLLLFAIPFWVTAFAAHILMPENFPWLPWFFMWLLKPLFDRIILHIISIRFFESGAGLKRICSGLGKSLIRGLAGDLLWRRFSPFRSAVMPVRVLELNLKPGKNTAERKKNLEKGGIGYCFLLTVWGIILEAVLLSGLIIFIITMGELISGGFLSRIEEIGNIEIYIYAAWCVNYMLVESIYVCMGFNLYINSRVGVEGWDIEITFRDLTKNITDKLKNGALAAIILAFLFLPGKTYAEEPANGAPLETLQNILESPDFGGEKDAWGIRFKKTPEIKNTPDISSDSLQRVFAHLLRIILIFFIAGFLVFIFIYIRRRHWKKTGGNKKNADQFIYAHNGDDPEKLLDKALIFNKQGKTRLAWGYCAAAAIQSWRVYHGIAFSPNATESDCAEIVKSKISDDIPQLKQLARDFNKLIMHWIYFAYAGRNPPEGSFEEAADLCVSLRTKNG